MLGENIRNLRKEKEMSQEELAERLSVTRQSVSLWETGKAQPSLALLTMLANLFEISTDALLGNDMNVETKNDDSQQVYTKTKTKKAKCVFYIVGIGFIVLCALLLSFVFNKDFSNNPKAIEEASKSVVLLNCYDDNKNLVFSGSGFVLFEENIVVTNYHVIEDGVWDIEIEREITENVKDRIKVKAVVLASEEDDIAILKAERSLGLPVLETGNSKDMHKGENVVAIGSPLGIMNTVSTGVFSRYTKDSIQFTASISSGSSGGALFNNKGKVIGITYASFEKGQNLNLAVPIEKAIDCWGKRDEKEEKTVSEFQTEHLPPIERWKEDIYTGKLKIRNISSNIYHNYGCENVKITDSQLGLYWVNKKYNVDTGEYQIYDINKMKSMGLYACDKCH